MDIILNKKDLNGKAAVYVAWGRGRECLYVGMTCQGFLRPLTNQILRTVWDKIERICIQWCVNSDIAREREGQLIRELNPLLNRVGKVKLIEANEAFLKSNGNVIETASSLGVSRATLYRRLAAYQKTTTVAKDG